MDGRTDGWMRGRVGGELIVLNESSPFLCTLKVISPVHLSPPSHSFPVPVQPFPRPAALPKTVTCHPHGASAPRQRPVGLNVWWTDRRVLRMTFESSLFSLCVVLLYPAFGASPFH